MALLRRKRKPDVGPPPEDVIEVAKVQAETIDRLREISIQLLDMAHQRAGGET